MTKLLHDAIERLRELPEKRQNQLAVALIEVADADQNEYHLTDEQVKEVGRRRADFAEGRERYATDDEMAALWKKCGL